MAAKKPKQMVIENNRAVVGRFPKVVWANPSDADRYQEYWVRVTREGWEGDEWNAEMNGYTYVNPDEVKMGQFSSADGTRVRFAENVLMKCPKEDYLARRKENLDRDLALQKKPGEDVMNEHARLGIKPLAGVS